MNPTELKEFLTECGGIDDDRKFWLRLMKIELMTLSPHVEEAKSAAAMVRKAMAERNKIYRDWPADIREHLHAMGVRKTLPDGSRKSDIIRGSHKEVPWRTKIYEALCRLPGYCGTNSDIALDMVKN